MSLLDAISQAWALEHRTLCNMAELVRLHAESVKRSPDEIKDVTDTRDAARAAVRPMDSMLSARDREAGFYMVGEIAVVPIEGVIANRAGMVNNISSPRGMSDAEVIKSVNGAAASGAKGIVLHIDSPGGTVAGTSDSVEAISAVAARMPVVAFAELAASKGYWLACLAHHVMAGPLAIVGSIGVYTAVVDTSRIAERDGVKVHVIKRGEYKTVGYPGEPIATGQLKPLQDEIDRMYEAFTEVVSTHRGLKGKALDQVAQGQTFCAPDGLAFGLIDSIGNLEAAIAKASSLAKSNTPARTGQTRKAPMTLEQLKESQPAALAEHRKEILAEAATAEKQRTDAAVATAVESALKAEREKKPAPATRAELKLIVPATMAGREDLIGELQDKNATAAEAQAAVVAKLDEQNKALAAKVEEVQKTGKVLGNAGKGVNPISFVPGADGGDDKFAALVQSIVTAEKCSVNIATAKAQAKDPALHRDWVDRGCPKINAA